MRLFDTVEGRLLIQRTESWRDPRYYEVPCPSKVGKRNVVRMQLTCRRVVAVIVGVRSPTYKLFEKYPCRTFLIKLDVRNIDTFPTESFINEPAETICSQPTDPSNS